MHVSIYRLFLCIYAQMWNQICIWTCVWEVPPWEQPHREQPHLCQVEVKMPTGRREQGSQNWCIRKGYLIKICGLMPLPRQERPIFLKWFMDLRAVLDCYNSNQPGPLHPKLLQPVQGFGKNCGREYDHLFQKIKDLALRAPGHLSKNARTRNRRGTKSWSIGAPWPCIFFWVKHVNMMREAHLRISWSCCM